MHKILRHLIRKRLKIPADLLDRMEQDDTVLARLLTGAPMDSLVRLLHQIDALLEQDEAQLLRQFRALQISSREGQEVNQERQLINRKMEQTLGELRDIVEHSREELLELPAPAAQPQEPELQLIANVRALVESQRVRVQEQGRSRRAMINMMQDMDMARKSIEDVNQRLTEEIQERKNAEEKLQRTLEEMRKFNKLMTGREERVLELKREINGLLGELGRSAAYQVTA